MTSKQILRLWCRYLEGDAVSAADQNHVVKQIDADKALRRLLLTDLVTHGLLRGSNVTDAEPFVESCVGKFRQQLKQSHDRSGFSDFNETPAAPVVIKAAARQKPLDAESIRKRRRQRSIVVSALLAIASAVLIACFLFFYQPPDNPAAKSNSSAASDAEDGSDVERVLEPRSNNELPRIGKSEKSVNSTEPEEPCRESAELHDLVDRTQANSDQPDGIPESPARAEKSRKYFASVAEEKNARWLGAKDDQGRIGQGPVQLLFGTALLKLDNGAVIHLVAPVDFEFDSAARLSLKAGKARVNLRAMRADSDFAVVTPDTSLVDAQELDAFLYVDSGGTEVVLTAGSAGAGSAEIGNEPVLGPSFELGEENLTHLFANARNETETAVAVAHGKKQYLGQVGIGEDSFRASTPQGFRRILGNVLAMPESAADESGPQTEILERVDSFHSMIQEIEDPLPDGSSNRSSYSFLGEIIIDGQKVEFTVPEEFLKNSQELDLR